MHKNKHHNRKKAKIVLVALVVVAIVATVTINMILAGKNKPTHDAVVSNDQTTSTEPTAQADFSDGTEREPGNTMHENRGFGGISDNNGDISGNIDTSSPLTSGSGEISIYAPGKDAAIQSGAILAGISSLSSVSYRLIDSVSGVISTGSLKVVDGRFSGTLDFSTSASEGRIDIFGARSDGTEFSNIEIPVRFR